MKVGFGRRCAQLVSLTPEGPEQLNLNGFLDHLNGHLAKGFTPPPDAATAERQIPGEAPLQWARFWLLPDDLPTA